MMEMGEQSTIFGFSIPLLIDGVSLQLKVKSNRFLFQNIPSPGLRVTSILLVEVRNMESFPMPCTKSSVGMIPSLFRRGLYLH